ncbi:MAG TPA: HAD family hydrolase [Candidatus Deferrimicrobium sp.]|nr:HAD family hydrolase [Candidatus Deferrimicrobium sp.]
MATSTINNVNLNNIKAIVFDWNGTLFNSVPAIRAATQSVLEHFDIAYPEDGANEVLGSLMESIQEGNLPSILLNHYEILNGIPFFDELAYLQKLQVLFMIYAKYKEYTEVSQLFSGSKELLENLSQKFDLAILTSSKREQITQILEKFGILNYFKSILTVEDGNNQKLNSKGIQKMIQELHYLPKNVLYVGDSTTDILTAKAVNMPSIAIFNGLTPKQELMDFSPNVICDHVTEISQIFNLPAIPVDKNQDLQKTINYHAEKIKTYVKEEFNFFTLLQEVLPQELRFEAKQVSRIIEDPIGFVGAIISDGITKYTRGEIELRTQFTEFSKTEEDLLKCLGLIIIHFVNERSQNRLKKLINNPLTRYTSIIMSLGMKLVYQHLYPIDYKENFRKLFLKLFGRVIPAESLERLQKFDANDFTSSVLDGCELALYDLGLKKVRSLGIKPLKPLSRSLSSLLLQFPTTVIHEVWKKVNEISQDILQNDFRRYPWE